MIHESVILTCDHKNDKGEPACAAFWPHAVKITQPDGTIGVAMLGITQRMVDAGQVFSIKARSDGQPSNTFCPLHKPVDATAAKPAPQPAQRERVARPAPPAVRQPPSTTQARPMSTERPRFGDRMNRLKR